MFSRIPARSVVSDRDVDAIRDDPER